MSRAQKIAGACALVAAAAAGCNLIAHTDDYAVANPDAGIGGPSPEASSLDGSGDERAPSTDGGADSADSFTDAPPDAPAESAPPDAPAESAPPGCMSNAACTQLATEAGPDAGVEDAGPWGSLDGGIVPAVCVTQTGRCVPLLTADCRTITGNYLDDNAILLGTIFSTTGSLASANIPRQQAALLAAGEINSNVAGGGIPSGDGGPPHPLLVLSCDPTANPLRAASHLAIDLHVPGVVGPNVAEDAVNITQQVSASAGMLLMSPTVPIDPLTTLQDNGLTWRDIPSDKQRSTLYDDQIEALVTQLSATRGPNVKMGVLVRKDALGNSALDAISQASFEGSTVGNSNNVSIDTYALSDTAGQAAIASKYATTFLPDIVFVIAQEAVPNIVLPLEKQLAANDAAPNRPYYIATDTAKSSAWLSYPTMPGIPADFPTRVRGVGVTPEAASLPVFNSFTAAFKAAYGGNPGTSGMGPAYDAMYAIAYAIGSQPGQPVTGANIGKGLGQLFYGSAFPVGVNSANAAFQSLASAGHVALQGTFTLMHWDGAGDILGGTLQVWCIGTSSGAPTFQSSGRNLDLSSGQISGTYTQCN